MRGFASLLSESSKLRNIDFIKRIKYFSKPESDIYIYSVKLDGVKEKRVFFKVFKEKNSICWTQKNLDFYKSNLNMMNKNGFIRFPDIYYCKDNLIIREFIEGENLEDLFFSKRLVDPGGVLNRIGQGLRQVEDLFMLRSKDISYIHKIRMINKCKSYLPLGARKAVEKYIGRLKKEDFIDNMVINFGDVQLKNIILGTDGKLYLIDLDVFFGSKAMDAALLVYNLKRHLLRPNLFFYRAALSCHLNHFLNGFLKGSDKCRNLLQFNIFYLLIQNYVLFNSSGRSFIVKKYMSYNLVRQIKSLLEKGLAGFVYC